MPTREIKASALPERSPCSGAAFPDCGDADWCAALRARAQF